MLPPLLLRKRSMGAASWSPYGKRAHDDVHVCDNGDGPNRLNPELPMLLRKSIAALLWIVLVSLPAFAEAKTKKLSGKIRSVKENALRIEKSGLVGESYVEIETDSATQITGQLKPGLHITVKYREEGEKDSSGNRRKIAVEIETRPEFASKDAKKAAKQLEKK